MSANNRDSAEPIFRMTGQEGAEPIFRLTGQHQGPVTFRLEWQMDCWESLVWRVVDEPRWRKRLLASVGDCVALRTTVDHPTDEELADSVRDCANIPAELKGLVIHRLENPRPGRPRRGESPRELAGALRTCPGIEPEATEYVAGRLDGSIRRLKYRPEESRTRRWYRIEALKIQVRFVQASFRLQGIRDPATAAVEVVAKRVHIAPTTLAKKLKGVPAAYRSDLAIGEVDAQVKQAVADGHARLDKTVGLVWLGSPESVGAPRAS